MRRRQRAWRRARRRTTPARSPPSASACPTSSFAAPQVRTTLLLQSNLFSARLGVCVPGGCLHKVTGQAVILTTGSKSEF